ncbi:magnesium/cobalt transporter CorA [Candidatus Woesearchaeota archaeon]|nr:magnesium/cobalt transporter CorA [Candidatus Woesearchaeota archaeon]
MKLFSKTQQKIGLAPGTLQYTGKKTTEKIKIKLFDYNKDDFAEQIIDNHAELKNFIKPNLVAWVNVTGVHDTELISSVCDQFNIHPLVQEDIVNTNQRPKMEIDEESIFFVFHLVHVNNDSTLEFEQISMVLGNDYVLTFQETEKDIFDPIRERIRGTKWRIRSRGTDYLAYAIMDLVIDHYFYVLELLGQRIEELETEILKEPTQAVFEKVHHLRRELVKIRRAVWPLREVVSQFHKSESKLIDKSTAMYIRDLYDHTIQVIDTTENFREMSSSLVDMYMTGVSNKMNEVMKVLTIIATIFIPLTFVAGLYGMNFNFMPELGWHYGYFATLGVMVIVAIAMIRYFRKKAWM